LLIIGSNTPIPASFEALKSRILPIHNVLAQDKRVIKKPDDPRLFRDLRNRLTAWKARVMNQPLEAREHIDLEGRLFDMGEPFLQVLHQAYPIGYSMMVEYLKSVERQRLLERSDSGEAIVLSCIRTLFLEEASQQLMKTGERPVAVHISQKRLIEEVQRRIPKITNRGIMRMFRNTFGFAAEPIKTSYDYLHRIESNSLETLLVNWGLVEKETSMKIEVPDTPA
jgi:hypothetical protein